MYVTQERAPVWLKRLTQVSFVVCFPGIFHACSVMMMRRAIPSPVDRYYSKSGTSVVQKARGFETWRTGECVVAAGGTGGGGAEREGLSHDCPGCEGKMPVGV